MSDSPKGERSHIRYSFNARAFVARTQPKIVSEKPDKVGIALSALVMLLLVAASLSVGMCVVLIVSYFAPLWAEILAGLIASGVTGILLGRSLAGEAIGIIVVLLVVIFSALVSFPTIMKVRANVLRVQQNQHREAH